MTLDELISAAEEDAIGHLTDTVCAALVAATSWFLTPWGAFVLKWLLRPAIQWVVKTAVKGLDLGAFYLYKASKNVKDADKYEESVRATKAATESGDQDAIQKARAEQRRLFGIAIGLSS